MLTNYKELENLTIPKDSFLNDFIYFKTNNPDSLLLFQIGDFYETLFQDAEIFSQITGLTLGLRRAKDIGDIIQAGVPVKSVNLYLKKLLEENQKVCLCAQQKTETGESYRVIIRKYTKGTISEDEFLESNENNFILALTSSSKNHSISYADVSTGQFYKTSGNYNEILIEVEKVEPNELLILESEKENYKSLISKYNTTILDDSKFSDKNPENIIIEYCNQTQKSFKTKLDEIINYSPKIYLSMDETTRLNLELTRTRRFLKKKGSLLWFLNYTKTPMGSRLLKKYLDEPLLDINAIEHRLEAVKEILSTKNKMEKLGEILKKFSDISRICAKISNSTISAKDLYNIAINTDLIQSLEKICKNYKSNLLKINEKNLREAFELASELKDAIKEDAPIELKSGGLIKKGYYPELDYLKEKIKETENEIKKYENNEKKIFKTDKLKISHSNTIGYYIELPNTRNLSISNEYFKKQTLTNCTRYTTEKLNKFEEKINSLILRTNNLEYELFCELRRKAKQFIETMRKLAQDIARIDVLVSFANCASNNNLTKPIFNNKGIFIKNGFHPSLIKLNNEIIKNDTTINDSSMLILTGANMSGKSTFLKYNAIICLLSQIGSFVPADEANICIIDKLFLRQGATDDIINNNSSFMVEMLDFKSILENITKSSLILLDEPAKSTNSKEGGAIARAFCEYLLKNHSSKTIIATHNSELTKLENDYPNKAYNYVIGNSDYSESAIIDRKIKRGTVNSSMALNTAILAQLPEEIIQNAKNYIFE